MEQLKKWLLATDENRTPEEVDEDYPAILEDLKFYVAKQKIVDENDIKVEIADVEAMAVEVARAQFAQYGMTNLPADVLQNYAQGLLEKEETVRLPLRAGHRKQANRMVDGARYRDREERNHQGVR